MIEKDIVNFAGVNRGNKRYWESCRVIYKISSKDKDENGELLEIDVGERSQVNRKKSNENSGGL